MAKLSIPATNELLDSPVFIDGLKLAFGSLPKASKALGIGVKRLRAYGHASGAPSDKLILDMQRGLNKQPAKIRQFLGDWNVIGDKFSPRIIRRLAKRAEDPTERKRLIEAVHAQAGKSKIDYHEVISPIVA